MIEINRFSWKSGVAASLTYFSINDSNESPVLIPYPSWKANTIEEEASPDTVSRIGGHDNAAKATVSDKALADNSTIISTFRVRVDECNRLWVMDTGLADILGSPKQIAPPALVIFDLNTNQLIKRYAFGDKEVKGDTFFANVVSFVISFSVSSISIRFAHLSLVHLQIVDVPKNDCENAFAYIPDLGGYAVVVYSFKDDKSWRVKHNYFHFDPLNGNYNVDGVNFQWTDGVFGMALGRQSENK